MSRPRTTSRSMFRSGLDTNTNGGSGESSKRSSSSSSELDTPRRLSIFQQMKEENEKNGGGGAGGQLQLQLQSNGNGNGHGTPTPSPASASASSAALPSHRSAHPHHSPSPDSLTIPCGIPVVMPHYVPPSDHHTISMHAASPSPSPVSIHPISRTSGSHRSAPFPHHEEVIHPHSSSIEHVAHFVHTNLRDGLTSTEAKRRLAEYGPNVLPPPSLSFLNVLRQEMTSPPLLLLLALATLYSLWGDLYEALTALFIVIASMCIQTTLTYISTLSVMRLTTQAMSFSPPLNVLRNGQWFRIEKSEIVVGDIVEVRSGERIEADGRIISAEKKFRVDESPLFAGTQSSMSSSTSASPITTPARSSAPNSHSPSPHVKSKTAHDVFFANTPLSERTNMVFSGAVVTHGSARVIVTAIGKDTEMAHTIAASSTPHRIPGRRPHYPPSHRTPLQIQMHSISLRVTFVTCVLTMIAMSVAFMRGLAYRSVVLVGISLAVGSGASMMVSLVRAIVAKSSKDMADCGVLLTSMASAESLASLTVLLTSKTGVLTRNTPSLLRMAMSGLVLRIPHPSSRLPLRVSTDDMSAFEPLVCQGWMMSAEDEECIDKMLPPSTVSVHDASMQAADASSSTSRTAPISEYAFSHAASCSTSTSSLLTLSPFDSALLRFFAQRRTHSSDVNSAYLRSMFEDSLRRTRASPVVAVLSYDPIRRRSGVIRRTPGQKPGDEHLRLCVRGGAEPVLSVCSHSLHGDGTVIKLTTESREELATQLRKMAKNGMKILGFAVRRVEVSEMEKIVKRSQFQQQQSPDVSGIIGATPIASPSTITPSDSPIASPIMSPQRGTDPMLSPIWPVAAGTSASVSPAATTDSSAASSSASSTSSASSLPSSFTHTSSLALTALETHMTFLGFVGLGDTLREGVKSSVEMMAQAGVTVKMVTHDFEQSGAAVARAIAILPQTTLSKQMSKSAKQKFQQPFSQVSPAQTRRNGDDTDSDEEDDAPLLYRSNQPPSKFSNNSSAINSVDSSASPSPFSTPSQSSQQQPQSHSRSRSTSRESSMTRSTAAALAEHTRTLEGVCVGGLRCQVGGKEKNGTGYKKKRVTIGSIDAAGSFTPVHGPLSPRHTHSRTLPSALLHTPTYDLNARVYCRMLPVDRFNILLAHRKAGHKVMATYDSVHDVTSSAAADVSLAMSSTDSNVRENVGVILTKDDFRSIVVAIKEGRRMLENLSNAMAFYLAAKFCLILLFLGTLSIGVDLPLSPLHILLVSCMVDITSSYAFTHEPATSDLMMREPKEWQKEKLMKDWKFVRKVIFGMVLMLLSVGSVLVVAHYLQPTSLGTSEVFYERLHDISSYDSPSSSESPLTPSEGLDHLTHHAGEEESKEELRDPASSSSSSPHTNSHSSSSFFPSLLSHFHADPHLALTQSLVLTALILSSLLLACFMRSSERSCVFGCCDRRSRRRWKKEIEGTPEANIPTTATIPSSSTRLRPESQPPNYNTLTSSASARFDASYSLQAAPPATPTSPSDSIEGLSKCALSSRSHDPRVDTPSLLSEVCPLVNNPPLVVLTVSTILLTIALLLNIAGVRDALALTSLTQSVRISGVSDYHFPAYFLLVLPLLVFFLAEAGKAIGATSNKQKFSAACTNAYQRP